MALAVDYIVFNVTKEGSKVRMASITEDVWPQPSNIPLFPPDPKLRRTALSKELHDGRIVHRDMLKEVYEVINKPFGSNKKVPD